MIIHYGYENLSLVNPYVTVGVFDGVHLGHRAILDYLAYTARKAGGESVIITFDPHPKLVLSPNTGGLFFLSTLDEKKKLLAESGNDHLIIMNFTKELSNLEASDFIKEILVNKIGVKHLIVGYDNHFGKSKGGDFEKIRECAELLKFDVEHADEVSAPEGVISSTIIRNALLNGNIEDANRWLGYSYSLTGTVIEGRKLGRILGFPTANIKPADIHKLIPADGVYAVEVLVGNKKFIGMLSIGFNPTVNKEKEVRSIEVNIFNFDKNIYNRIVTIIFRFRLRNEIKFANVRLLSKQMELDKQTVMRLLA
jgi:riboflavin kinase / FMN adenylyltransferase